MNDRIDSRNPGTQEVIPLDKIGPPDYEVLDWEVDETLELLLDRAIEIGEIHSQMMIAAGRGPTPHAHRACTSYHAIEIIRLLQHKLKEAEATIQHPYDEATGEDL